MKTAYSTFYISWKFLSFLFRKSFNSLILQKLTKLLDKSELKDVADPNLLESESASDSDEEP